MNPFDACQHGEFFGSLSQIDLALASDAPLSWIFWHPEPLPPLGASLWLPVPFVADTATLGLSTQRTARGVRWVPEVAWSIHTDTADLVDYLNRNLYRDWLVRVTPANGQLRRAILPLRMECNQTVAGSPQEGSRLDFRLFPAGACKVFYDAPTTAPAPVRGEFNHEFNTEFN